MALALGLSKTIIYVGFEVLTQVVMRSTVSWDIVPHTPLPPALTLVSWLVYSLTSKTEVTRFSGTLVDFRRTTRHYIPEDSTPLLHVLK
jgi:hypothetical protein